MNQSCRACGKYLQVKSTAFYCSDCKSSEVKEFAVMLTSFETACSNNRSAFSGYTTHRAAIFKFVQELVRKNRYLQSELRSKSAIQPTLEEEDDEP